MERRELPYRNLRARRCGDQHARERVGFITQLPRIAHCHGVALAAFDCLGHCRAADRGLDDVLHVADAQAVTGRFDPIDVEIEETASRQAIRESASSARHIVHGILDRDPDALDFREIRTEHLDPDRAAHAGGEHLVTGLDRHPPDVRHAGIA